LKFLFIPFNRDLLIDIHHSIYLNKQKSIAKKALAQAEEWFFKFK